MNPNETRVCNPTAQAATITALKAYCVRMGYIIRHGMRTGWEKTYIVTLSPAIDEVKFYVSDENGDFWVDDFRGEGNAGEVSGSFFNSNEYQAVLESRDSLDL